MDGVPESLLRPETSVKRIRRKRETVAEQQTTHPIQQP
jgi:hypothetical protein